MKRSPPTRDSGSTDSLAQLQVNPEWPRLPLFDRTGWTRLPFSRFAESINERVEPADAADEPYVGLDHLDSEDLHIRRWGKGSDVIGTKLRFRKGDIIFGRRRAYQRKLAVAEFDGICSAHAMVVRARPEAVLPEFLPFLMMSDRFMKRAVEISVGSLSPTINWKALKSEEFELPPLDRQRRFWDVFSVIGQLAETCRKRTEAVGAARAMHLREAFGKADRFPRRRVDEAGVVQLGRQRAPQYQTGRLSRPYLRVANVRDEFIDYSDVLTMDFDAKHLDTFRLYPGDILLNEGQSIELVGRCAMFDGALDDCCFQNTLLRFRPGAQVLGDWALAYFRFCQQSGIFAWLAVKTTSIAHLAAGRFAAMMMPVPSLNEQERFVQEYRRLRELELAEADSTGSLRIVAMRLADRLASA